MVKTKKIVVVTQARVGSSRFPEKVLQPLGNGTLLSTHLTRLKLSEIASEIIVATTFEEKSPEIIKIASNLGVDVFQGSTDDVLDRFYQAVKKRNADYIVRVTSDCPLIDAHLMDCVIRFAIDNHLDYASNVLKEEYPDGQDVEVFTFNSLQKAWQEASLSSEREHVTPYIRRNSTFNGGAIFKSDNYEAPSNYNHIRMTVDEKEDLNTIKILIEKLGLKATWNTYTDFLIRNKHMFNNQIIKRNEGYEISLKNDIKIITKMRKSQDLYIKAKKMIPGGTQLLSKRPEQFLPNQWPAYYSKAKGCEIWDLDGNKYIDMSLMGVGACTLGYADEDVNSAVKECIENGSMTTLNTPAEVELAELLLELHPWAEMVRFGRGGGDAMAIAVRIARAATKKDIILFSGYHGWHDWYLAANLSNDSALDGQLLPGLSPVGVAHGMKGTSYPFFYDNKEEFLTLVERHRDNIGGIVLEAVRNFDPNPNFFQTLRNTANELNVPLISDEVSSGFRLNCGGAHLVVGLEPDIAVFAKGMSNGYPMGAVIGKAKFMDAAQDSFISSTYWTESIGPVAALATIRKMRKMNVQKHLIECGKKVQKGWSALAKKHGLFLHVGSMFPMSHFSFEEKPMILKTLFTQEMLKRGFLASDAYYSCFAHKSEHIEAYLQAVDEVFELIAQALKMSNPEQLLNGPICHAGFKRLA